jgi:hypothetical protein
MSRSATQLGWILVLLLSAAVQLTAQTGAGTQNTGTAPAANGLDTTSQMSENPPLSGLDVPSFEPGFGARSYLAPRAEVSEAFESNGSANLSSAGNVNETTRALGSLELQKLWKVHPFDLDYVGGVDWFNGGSGRVYQIQSLGATQRFLWRTGQLALRDTFSYLPEGTFGFSAYGGAGGFTGGGGMGGLGGGVFSGGEVPGFANDQFGSVGIEPRIGNMAVADVTQYLSPRAAVVVAGGYGVTKFLNNPGGSACSASLSCFFNSEQSVAQAGYNYQLSRRDQIAIVYAFEELHFPTVSAGSVTANIGQLMYGHRISGKLNFLIGGGPEWVRTHQTQIITVLGISVPAVTNSSFLSGSARMTLTYHPSTRTNLHISYMRYVNTGSGFFAGASTDTVRAGVDHSLSRRWNMMTAVGYARNSRLLAATAPVAGNAHDYHFWFLGGALRRQLSRQFGAFASYQYESFGFGSGSCGSATNCNARYGRNIGLIGVDWTPLPIRLD